MSTDSPARDTSTTNTDPLGMKVPDVTSWDWPSFVDAPSKDFITNILDATWSGPDHQPEGLAAVVYSDWSTFGTGQAQSVPTSYQFQQVGSVENSVHSSTLRDYTQKSQSLKAAFVEFQKSYSAMAKAVGTTDDNLKTARQNYQVFVNFLNEQASTAPPDGDEHGYIIGYVSGALSDQKQEMDAIAAQIASGGTSVDQSAKDLQDAKDKLDAANTKIDTLTKQLADQEAAAKAAADKAAADKAALQQQIDALKAGQMPPGSTMTPYVPSPNPFQPNSPGTTGAFPWDTGAQNMGTPSNTGSTTDTTGTDPNASVIKAINDAAANTGQTMNPSTTSGLGSSLGGGLGDLMNGPLGQMMMMNSLNRQNEMANPNQYPDPTRQTVYPQTAQPAVATTAAPAATQPAQPAAAQPAQPAAAQPAGPNNQATSTQPAVAPGRVPDADGSITYPFPDGKTQKVSPLVAQALDAAFSDHSATSAQSAYGKTSAKWSDTKHIGPKVDPSQLMTGDVATWQNDDGTDRTAIVRVIGTGPDATLDVVINGDLKPFDQVPSDFGTFAGFAHPKGIELGSADSGSDTGVAVAGDPLTAAPAVMPT